MQKERDFPAERNSLSENTELGVHKAGQVGP